VADVSKYWKFVKLTSNNKYRVEMIAAVRTYVESSFPSRFDVADTAIQQQFWQKMRLGEKLAEVGLRCYISHKIYQVCFDLGSKFGSRNGFNYQDLLPYVLDDEVLLALEVQQNRPSSAYQSLATTILTTFHPNKGSLSTWVNRYVKQHPDLKQFLLQHGVFLVSDWALLNDANPKHVKRILVDMYRSTNVEATQACDLLISYHAVYREERIEQRLTGATLPCQPPTAEQLIRIADDLQKRTGRKYTREVVLNQLNGLASKIREYRITVQGGSVLSVSFDEPAIQAIVEQQQVAPDAEEEKEFLNLYQNQFLESLDQAISLVINDFLEQLRRKKSGVEESFLTALHLFHCQGESMSQIAPQIGLRKQYEVTRLLKLNELRADIRQKLLVILRDRVLDIAKYFANSERLEDLDKQVESILEEQISGVIQQAESEAKNPIRNQPLRNLLARRLCHYLNARNTKLC
jgi:hypothetical protein